MQHAGSRVPKTQRPPFLSHPHARPSGDIMGEHELRRERTDTWVTLSSKDRGYTFPDLFSIAASVWPASGWRVRSPEGDWSGGQ